jgi:hypothetical protein
VQPENKSRICRWLPWLVVPASLVFLAAPSLTRPQSRADDKPKDTTPSSYDQIAPVLLGKESFQTVMARDKADKGAVTARQRKLLEERYDLTARTDKTVTMSRGKPIPIGPAVKLPGDMTWEKLAKLSPEEIRAKGLFPKGFLPLPHPKHEVGGMLFPQMELKVLPRLERSTSTSICRSNSCPSSPRRST